LHAGLAIDGWLVLEPGRGDWFLWFYPVEQWFRDVGTFVEHTHRQFGSAVGLLAIATVVACWRTPVRAVALAALVAVIAQGTLGGLRVLEASSELAFLHGAFGQAVFALLGAVVVATSRAWTVATVAAVPNNRALRSWSLAGAITVYVQIFVGAWLRHTESLLALTLHLVLIVAVLLCVLRTAKELRGATEAAPAGIAPALRRARSGLVAALVLQLFLGVAAFLSVYVFVGRDPQTIAQSLFPTLHVIGGALLLYAAVASAMWSTRLTGDAGATRIESPHGEPGQGASTGPNLGGAL
jgi:heme a synthase